MADVVHENVPAKPRASELFAAIERPSLSAPVRAASRHTSLTRLTTHDL
jgi:hypothetical protein